MSLAWVAQQIQAVSEAASPNVIKFNPKPPGQPQAGGATEAVMAFMRSRPGVWMSFDAIAQGCSSHSHKAVQFALHRLRGWGPGAWGSIEYEPDIYRNTRYYRYRCVIKD